MPTGGRLTSWLFTKRGESGRAHDLNPGPEDYKSSALNDTPSPLNTNNDLSPNTVTNLSQSGLDIATNTVAFAT